MTRFAKSLIALAAAHTLLCALFLGSIASGRAVASPFPLCSAAHASSDGNSAPAPVSRDLACLVSGCCGCAAPSPVPAVSLGPVDRAPVRIAWRETFSHLLLAGYTGVPSARAPPRT